jgi:predicted nucleotidyltransferase component of viral defense system
MSADFLHNHRQFSELIRIVAQQKGIDSALVEKDYWIMHCLYGLQQLSLKLELKGGTSLSKGFQIIDRFSEDIDIRIEPPKDQDVKTGRNHDKPAHIQSPKTKRSFWPIRRRAKSTPRRLPKAQRSITATNRRSIKSSKRLALGSTGCERSNRPH